MPDADELVNTTVPPVDSPIKPPVRSDVETTEPLAVSNVAEFVVTLALAVVKLLFR